MGLLCDMQLDNQTGVYAPGDILSGRVVLTLGERMLLKALAMKVLGRASTRWEKPSKKTKEKQKKKKSDPDATLTTEPKKKATCYTDNEYYISTTNYFIGSEEALTRVVDSGVYAYNFSVRLPQNCPSSFESNTGHIRYDLNVFIDYGETQHNCFSRTLLVERAVDLRQDRALLTLPSDAQFLEKIRFTKFWHRPLQLYINIPQAGYVPGEIISVHAKLLNYDLLTLTEIIYKLNLVSTYTGLHKNKTKASIVRTSLQKVTHALRQNGKIVQHLQELGVPQTPPTILWADCKCIQIAYEVEVTVNTAVRKRWLCARVPIKIGTVSLHCDSRITQIHRQMSNSAPALSVTRSMNDLADLPDDGCNGFGPSAPRPETPDLSMSMTSLVSTFKEADFMTTATMNKKSKRTMPGEQIEFRPRYLIYDMTSQQETNATTISNSTNGAMATTTETTTTITSAAMTLDEIADQAANTQGRLYPSITQL